MYSISAYGDMIADRVRMDAYVAALRQNISPNSIVLDIGTGTGIFALLSCQFGARRVYAIESGDTIEVARQIAEANGMLDRIEFIQAMSTEVTLPDRANVMISDMRGVLPYFQHNIPAVIDARRRLLDAGAVIIPLRDDLWASLVESAELHQRLNQWNDLFVLDHRVAQKLVANTWWRGRTSPSQQLTSPQRLATLDYTTVENPNVSGELKFSVTKTGTGHGINVWFDTLLARDIGFSNGPESPEVTYGSAFFPWLEPVPLTAGDVVQVKLSGDLVGEDYVWRWQSSIFRESGVAVAHFKQSTFLGTPLSLAHLRKRADSYCGERNDVGEVALLVLTLMDGTKTTAEIAAELLIKFPKKFLEFKDALSHVADLTEKYSQ